MPTIGDVTAITSGDVSIEFNEGRFADIYSKGLPEELFPEPDMPHEAWEAFMKAHPEYFEDRGVGHMLWRYVGKRIVVTVKEVNLPRCLENPGTNPALTESEEEADERHVGDNAECDSPESGVCCGGGCH